MDGSMRHWLGSLLARFTAAGVPFVAVLLAGCMADAEHTHPLDPNSDTFRNEGSLAGNVSRLDGAALSGAEVRLDPGSYVAVSGESGEFQLNGMPPGTYELFVSKDGFAANSDAVEIHLGEVTQIVKQVDALPTVSAVAVCVGYIGRPLPQADLYVLDVAATVDDPDGGFDLDTVWMEIPQANYAGALDVTTTSSRFKATVAASELSLTTMHSLVGKNVLLYAQDRAGFSVNVPAAVVRVIDQIPVTVSQHVTAEKNAELTWQAVNLPYPFTYRVEVFRTFGTNIHELYRVQADIDAKTSSIHFEIMDTGDYFWTLSVVDEFGNWSQSKPEGFSVP